MGSLISKIAFPFVECGDSMVNIFTTVGRKRKRHQNVEHRAMNNDPEDEPKPKRKKLLTTTQYIYQALFKEQKNSDITIMALDRVWNLHKVYLSQSLYFRSMFNGSWKETNDNFVNVKILDKRIKPEALDAVFGSLYSDEIEIDVKHVVSILATAAMFQIECIIDRCGEVMIENLNVDTVIDYYEAAVFYGSQNVQRAAFEWLEINLLSIYSTNLKLLRDINIELMVSLVASPSLYVIQTEFSLYTMLRTWLYLQLFPDYQPEQNGAHMSNSEQIQTDYFYNPNFGRRTDTANNNQISPIQTYFSNRNTQANINFPDNNFNPNFGTHSFLESNEGRGYWPVFQALRTQYLITHQIDLKTLFFDNILPKKWIYTHALQHWNSVLKVDQHSLDEDLGNIENAIFDANCVRCGRLLSEPGYHKWRWTGFHFGLDLILIADARVFSLRRLHRNEHERLLSLQMKRKILVRISVSGINAQLQPLFTQKSEIRLLELEKNEDQILLVLEGKITHPLLVSLNLLLVPPNSHDFKENGLTIATRGRMNSLQKESNFGAQGDIANASVNDNPQNIQYDGSVSLPLGNPTPRGVNHHLETVSTSRYPAANDYLYDRGRRMHNNNEENEEEEEEIIVGEEHNDYRSDSAQSRNGSDRSVSQPTLNYQPLTREEYIRRRSISAERTSSNSISLTNNVNL